MISRIRKKIRNMSIRKKIVFYAYIVLVPILVTICTLLAAYRYTAAREEREQRQISSIHTLADSLEIIQKDINYLSLNMAINQEIRDVLNESEVERLNEDTNLWMHETPVQMIEEIIALKGYVKTVSIYPENGVLPYLRCVDSSAYVPELEQIRASDVYQETVKNRGKGMWVRAEKGESPIYQVNNVEKLVLCREVFDLSRQKPLGFVTIGIAEEEVRSLCENALQSEDEGILLLNYLGVELGRYGNVPTDAENYLLEKMLLEEGDDCREFEKKELYLHETESGDYICKIVPKKFFWDYFQEIVYMPDRKSVV